MITKLRLKNFKSFEDVEIKMGPVTTLIGTNASGKSNIKDALRLLHGIARGYTLAEAIGEKWVESGVLQWKGIRGGTREMVFHGSEGQWCEIGVEFWAVPCDREKGPSLEYSIQIELEGGILKKPKVRSESLLYKGKDREFFVFKTTGANKGNVEVTFHESVFNQIPPHGFNKVFEVGNGTPVISQLLMDQSFFKRAFDPVLAMVYAEAFKRTFRGMRFLDVSPDAMRHSSPPGQRILSDRGENLSSVLYEICEDDKNKELLLEWIRELTPQDVKSFEFFQDHQGRVLVELVDSNGKAISAYSASDGTLRFLAMIAALLSPEQAGFYFFEEVENGIHPSRLHLLVQLMEQRGRKGGIKLMLSTHSPQLLGYLSNESKEFASLVYRTSSSPSSRVTPILDVPYIKEAFATQDVSEMHASGWFENVMEFVDPTDDEQE